MTFLCLLAQRTGTVSLAPHFFSFGFISFRFVYVCHSFWFICSIVSHRHHRHHHRHYYRRGPIIIRFISGAGKSSPCRIKVVDPRWPSHHHPAPPFSPLEGVLRFLEPQREREIERETEHRWWAGALNPNSCNSDTSTEPQTMATLAQVLATGFALVFPLPLVFPFPLPLSTLK